MRLVKVTVTNISFCIVISKKENCGKGDRWALDLDHEIKFEKSCTLCIHCER